MMGELPRARRISVIEARLRLLSPVWRCCHRTLYLSDDGIYILRGHDNGEWFYFAINMATGAATNLLGGPFGWNEFTTAQSVFQSARISRMATALARWFNTHRSR
jgi:hypothetical protein